MIGFMNQVCKIRFGEDRYLRCYPGAVAVGREGRYLTAICTQLVVLPYELTYYCDRGQVRGDPDQQPEDRTNPNAPEVSSFSCQSQTQYVHVIISYI